MNTVAPSKIAATCAGTVAVEGLRARPLRAVLSGLGIALGVAALVAVVGLSASSKAQVNLQLDALGTNLLTASSGSSIGGGKAQLPEDAVAMVRRIGPVNEAGALATTDARVYRNDRVDANETGGIAVRAATLELPRTVSASLSAGRWLTPATQNFPVTVLGSVTAQRLGMSRDLVANALAAGDPPQVWLGGRWFSVVGVLQPSALAPELDRSSIVGWPAAETYLGFDGHPTTIYERSSDDSVEQVRSVLAATVSPSAPEEVEVSRPSDALAAKAASNSTLTALLLALGAVSLLVGGVGVANTMVIAVLERRQEIGLRRALGATRNHILWQFLGEAVVLSVLGGLAGAALGAGVTVAYSVTKGWPVAIPPWAVGAGVLATVLVGVVAGIYPAAGAARLNPTAALTS